MFKQLAKESVSYGSVGIITASFSFITIPFFTRVFSIEDYGTIGLITTTALLLPILYGLSLETAYTRYFNDPNFIPKALLQVIVKFQTLYGLFILAIGLIVTYISLKCLGLNSIITPVAVVLVSALLMRYVSLSQTHYRMKHDIGSYAIISLISSVFGALTSIGLVYYFGTISAYFIGMLTGAFLSACFAYFKSRRLLEGLPKAQLSQMRTLLRFSLPLIPGAAATFLHSSLDRWMLAIYQSNVEVAIYTVGMSMASIATMGLSYLALAFLPHSMQIIQKETDIANKLLERSLRYYSVVAGAGVILLQLISLILVELLAPVEYANAVSIVGFLALSSVFFGYTYFSVLGSWKAERSSDYSWAIGWGVTLNALLNFFFVPPFGIIGAAISTAAGMLLTVIISFSLSHIRHKFMYSLGKFVITNLLVIIWIIIFVQRHTLNLSLYFCILSGAMIILSILILNVFQPLSVLNWLLNMWNRARF